MKHQYSVRASLLAMTAVIVGTCAPASAGIVVNSALELQSFLSGDPSQPTHNAYKSQLDGLFAGSSASVWTGGVTVSGKGTLLFYYHGQESGYHNTFTATATSEDGSTSLSYTENGSHSPIHPWNPTGVQLTNGSVGSLSMDVGDSLTLQFTGTNGAVPGTAGDLNPDNGFGFGIFRDAAVSTGDAGFLVDGRIYFGYDDRGAGEDDNHDDMIISMKFVADPTQIPGGDGPVPEPATLAIWGLGLGIAGLVRLRRSKLAV